jgi:hypothetical protein
VGWGDGFCLARARGCQTGNWTWKETVVNEQANKDDKPFLVDDARQRLIDEIDRIRARNEPKGE